MRNTTCFLICLSLMLAISLCSFEASAQADPQNSISISFGGGTVPEFIGITDDLVESMFTEGTRTTNAAYSGALSIQYDRKMSSRCSLGIGFIYESITEDIEITEPSDQKHSDAYKQRTRPFS